MVSYSGVTDVKRTCKVLYLKFPIKSKKKSNKIEQNKITQKTASYGRPYVSPKNGISLQAALRAQHKATIEVGR